MAKRGLNKRHYLMLKWGLPCGLATIGLSVVVVVASARKDPSAPDADGTIRGLTSVLDREITDAMVNFTFEDATASSGIAFRHFPATRGSLLPEDMGSGVAWGDYDDDGDPDLFLVNFHGSILDPIPDDTPRGRCALYRNDGDGVFTDVSEEAGLDLACFGLAAAWCDYDDDDDLDLYLTCYGPNRLFRNEGEGFFTDVTADAGVGDDQFGAGCVWGDYDNDGHVDLYVCNYVAFEYDDDPRNHPTRQYGSEIPYTINPSSYRPQSNRLYRNRGDGTFEDVAEGAGVANPNGRSLGAVWFDFNLDGWTDLYVANDISSNGVFLNMGDGTFADIGASSLAADYRGAMGLAVGDYERDGDLDLFVTHWVAQENALYENGHSYGLTDDEGNPRLVFMDSAELQGLGHISLRMVGWATGFVDFDNDSNLDLWVVNGNTLEEADDTTKLKPQEMQLYWKTPDAGFFEIAARACDRLVEPFVGRGGAYADYDGDGRVDLAVMVHGGDAMLLRNTTENDHHWLNVRLRQSGQNTRALGAQVRVRSGDLVQLAQVGADGSYLSQHDTDLHFGLGGMEAIDEITIRWPDGVEETIRDVEVDRVLTVMHTPQYE